jgi:hypothetical protein
MSVAPARLTLAPLALAALLLAGCAPSLPIPGPDVLEGLIEDQTGGEVGLGTDLPDDWPSELPLPEGDLVAAVAVDGTHGLTYRIADESAGERLVAALEAIGFVVTGTADLDDLVATNLDRDGWAITVGWVFENDDTIVLSYNSGAH